VILLLNGAFGIGKTTVARALVSRVPDSMLLDPEIIGIALQRSMKWCGRRVEDFQDLKLWRTLTIAALRAARHRSRFIVVPMAISDSAYLAELKAGIGRFEPRLIHACLVAPKLVVHSRLRGRGANPLKNSWEFRRSAECCDAHISGAFAKHIDAAGRTTEQIAGELLFICGFRDLAA
jgi:hypothetical protein